jgi:hypothetical protein
VPRILESIIVIVTASNLIGCAGIVAQNAAQNAVTTAAACVQEVKSSPEGKIVYARLWANDDSDNAEKLSDPKPLTKEERNALVQVHNKLRPCRQIIIAHDNKFAAWETPYWQDLFQRSDAIFSKTASGEISVGLANKLTIESVGKFQADVSRAHADAVRIEEAQRQRAAEAMIQSGTQLLIASQPRSQITTTNCSWMGNTLNCTSVR